MTIVHHRSRLRERQALLCLMAGALAACATSPPAEPKIVTKDVRIEVPVACVPPSLAPAPTFTDTATALKAAPSAEDRYRLLSGNWFPRDARLALLEGVVLACRRPPAPP